MENVSKEKLVQMLERMWLIRHFEVRVMEVHSAGEFTGAAHPYIGEEAVAVGACAALEDTDYIAGNHRSHGHPLAKGGSVKRAMAELYGRVDGYCKGKGGSMHLSRLLNRYLRRIRHRRVIGACGHRRRIGRQNQRVKTSYRWSSSVTAHPTKALAMSR